MAPEPYRVIARKYRPESFDDVIGQQHITRTLQNAIESGRIGHAFLFIGSRGIGKTTSARILAKALNCLSSDGPTPTPCLTCDNCVSIAKGVNLDVIEIDGASNNSVDDVRAIREAVQMVPSSSRYKIYIIDEVHQLSGGAFNALLKTLEEPPPHAKFILATTEAHKVPATIISRCQRYDFRRVGQRDIQTLLSRICDSEGIEYEDAALGAIARAADGGIRDSESILDQIISYCGDRITFNAVFEVLGLVTIDKLHALCDALLAKDVATMLSIVDEVAISGKDLPQFIEETLRYFRNLLVCRSAGDPALLNLPEDEAAEMHRRAQQFGLTELVRLVEQLSDLFKRDFDVQLAPRIAFEAFLIRVSKVAVEVSVDSVLDKLAHLGAGGIVGAAPAAPAAAPPVPPADQPAAATPAPEPEKPAAKKAPAKKKAEAKKPPPDAPPPGPLPDSGAPVRQAEEAQQRMPATNANLHDTWQRVVEAAREEHGLSMAIWLGTAKPEAVDGDCLVLTLEEIQTDQRDRLERPATRSTVEALLHRLTANLTGYRIVWRATAPATAIAGNGAALPATAGVAPEDLERLLHDEKLAQVIDIFKGKVVEVRPGPQGVKAKPEA